MELYKDQFYSKVKDSDAKPFSEKQKTKPPSFDVRKDSDTAGNSKPKINDASTNPTASTNSTTVTENDQTPNDIAKKISKKHAKKMAWKKRQRLQKESRLQAQKKAKISE